MKKAASFVIVAILCILSLPTVYATETIVECPEIKIVIDGQMNSYTDTPLIVNDRTMLPLREVLANLGVQDDDEHIIWDNGERSVTIITDSKTIVLKIDSNIAVVNGEEVVLDVAPIIYSKISRTYIPARFVAETLNKKVVWHDETRAVLVTEEENFNEISEILAKCNKTMQEIEKFKMALDYDISATRLDETKSFKIGVTAHVDENEDIYMKMLMDMDMEESNPDQALMVPFPFVMEFYQVGDTSYFMSNIFGGQWFKGPSEESSTPMSTDVYEMEGLEDPTLVSGLILEETDESYLLSGDAYLEGYLGTAMSPSAGDAEDISYDSYELEFTIDKATFALDKMLFNISVTTTDAEGIETKLDADIIMEFNEFNGDFEIKVPDDVVENAIDQYTGIQPTEDSTVK